MVRKPSETHEIGMCNIAHALRKNVNRNKEKKCIRMGKM